MEREDRMRPDIKSTQLGGIANLALIAPVRPGFIPGADTYTYARRLEVLFKTLMAIRLGGRESSRHATPFPDAVGRWGLLQSFRYALIPPEIGSRGESAPADVERAARPYRLYLSVAFDGGWESYMRVIYRDLGYLLDTIFCNCVGYRLSTQHTYDQYIRWVRDHEVPAGLFYTESPATVLDHRYLAEVERLQRHEPDPVRARAKVAGLGLQPPPGITAALTDLAKGDAERRREVVANNLRALKGLFDLRAFYPNNDEGEEDRLRRFARSALPEFIDLLAQKKGEPWLAPHREPVDWVLEKLAKETPAYGKPAHFDPAEIQAGLLEPYVGVTRGCLLLLRVTRPAAAREWIAALPAQAALRQPMAGGRLYWNIAFTANGLRALGQPPETIDLFPQEFIEGMEARAGLLGDVRGNHPEHWRRPRLRGTNVEIDLGSVHVVVQYRLAAKPSLDAGLHPFLGSLADDISETAHGLQVLSVEPMRSYPTHDRITREHFGFEDGFSQPRPEFAPPPSPAPAPPAFNDAVRPGELFLGHPSDREDGRFPAWAATPGDPQAPDRPIPLIDNGSFLVIRKLRQDVGRWQAVLDGAARGDDPHFDARPEPERAAARERIASMLMGRRHDGTLVLDPALGKTNDFNYAADPQGTRCPFQSHIRRANPRWPGPQKMPRILRRGMSYGPRFEVDPAAERGLFFMAYCGSIAEQFEIIQRWMAGGNSSGVHSSHGDPMLGVPEKGHSRAFQWLGSDGKVAHVDLGDEPITELQWGLYLFAPSLAGLKVISAATAAPPTAAPAPAPADRVPRQGDAAACPIGEPYQPAGPVFEERKLGIQGRREIKDAFWRDVHACGGQVQTAYGLLEARKEHVLEILRDGSGTAHSVCGYGRRFEETVGPGFLGMDGAEHHRLAVASGIKDAIARIREPRAYEAARQHGKDVLDEIVAEAVKVGQVPTIDLVRLGEKVIARLYKEWFGLPDGTHMLEGFSTMPIGKDDETARCPRDFFFVARHNFGAHPTATERGKGTTRGQAIEAAVRHYIEKTPVAQFTELTRSIHDALMKHPDPNVGRAEVIHTVGGVMLGFGPSVHQHYVQVVREWVEPSASGGLTLWDLQVRLLTQGPPPSSYAIAKGVLGAPLVAQMKREPVPAVIWREVPGPQPAPGAPEPPKTVLGLHGLMGDADAEALMFGGMMHEGHRLFGVHACPGHGMAMGVLLGLVAALLMVGTLKKTPSPTILQVGSP